MARKYLPIACSLSARDSRDQIGEWERLATRAVTIDPVEGGYAVIFNLDVASDVEDLAGRESACCEFLDIETSRTVDRIQLVMTAADPDAMPVIKKLVGAPTTSA